MESFAISKTLIMNFLSRGFTLGKRSRAQKNIKSVTVIPKQMLGYL